MERVGCIHLIVDTECGTVKVKEGCGTDENVLSGSGRTTSSTGSAREREYVSGCDGYAVGPCCEWKLRTGTEL